MQCVVEIGAKQVVHLFLGGKGLGLGIQQGTSVLVGSPTYIVELNSYELHPGDEKIFNEIFNEC